MAFRLVHLSVAAAGAFGTAVAGRHGERGSTNPVQKVLQLLANFEMKIIKDGQQEQKAFDAFMDWCANGAKDKQFEIKTAKSSIEDLGASIAKADSDISTGDSKIEDLAADVTANGNDLKAATNIREKEHKEFVAVEAELTGSIDTLERAINILQRKMHDSTLLQSKVDSRDVRQLVQVLSTVIDAAALSLHDKQTLIGLVQSGEEEADYSLDPLGAPDPVAYKSHSESITDVLEDLKQKAVTQLDEARREEASARHNFELLKQSLEDEIKVANKELSDAKTLKHDAAEVKATAEGDLTVTKKDLADAENTLRTMKSDCMTKASDHEATLQNRAEELKAIAAAKKALSEMGGGAALRTYNATSLLQLVDGHESRAGAFHLLSRADLANFEVVNLVRKLARKERSPELAQLADRITNLVQSGTASNEEPFAKVKALITDMIERLMKEAGEEASHKAYCDKEYGETKAKIDDLKYGVEKYSSKLDKAKADSATLKDEVATLSREIAELTKTQGEADAMRKEEHKNYVEAKADLEQGLSSVRQALRILREYFADSSAAAGASLEQQPEMPEPYAKSTEGATGIIAMLEVVESDFGKSLAGAETTEETSATAYEKLSMENRVSKAMKEKEVQYKDKEASSLEKQATELTSDRETTQTELDAVLQYSTQLRNMCEVKPESYSERTQRREAEIAGLREALQILEGEAAFLQRRQRRGRRSGKRGAFLGH